MIVRLIERLRISNDQYKQKVLELDALSDRHQRLYEQCTRYDIECNRATEDLTLVTSKLEEMRNENANLRAEKKIWEASHIHHFIAVILKFVGIL
jgi:nucleoprotein TPR